ncbi:titin isoform X1 [Homalodisca vitripennis]|uniref:titin isoform X1 n=1 Tax=Homalodisca vitripennis TaxID=197043 RepID=UPI001EEC360A|nr:titin isoform X1 [Homalodisca vitripennis]
MTKFPPWQAYYTNLPPGKQVPPPVPIKTYKWEDVRRERLAGVYPWTHVIKGPFDDKEFQDSRDHEYEPINPPSSQPVSPPLLRVTDQEGQDKVTEVEKTTEKIDFTPIIDRSEHQFLRIPLNSDLVIPIGKEEIESLKYEDEEDKEQTEHAMTAQDIQDQMEERYFSGTPTTTISRTDGEFNTSQMDSSGLDELPLKKDARRGFNPKGLQQRLQTQAGRLRSRIRSIPRPKINFPERPKIHLPERPKFNFPERPKFNFPERPKFNIKRPDIKLPNFNFGKTKTSSIRRPLRDRSQVPSNQSTVGSKKNIFDSINFRTYPRIFSKKKKTQQGRRALTPPPRMETESTPPSSPASRTGPINQRWSQRFKDIKFVDSDNQSDLKKPSFDDEVEDDSAAFRDTDFKTAIVLSDKKQMKTESSNSIPGSDKEQQSSGTSSERHRAGVIEEIDSDEFFLREKGLSREDVDVSRYLSLEIRDAFRSPKNALARLDGDLYDEDNEGYELETPQKPLGEPIRLSMEAIRKQSLEQIRMTPERDEEYRSEPDQDEGEIEVEPVRPERTRSLKKRATRSVSEESRSETDNQFNTFPPNRPNRVRKQSSQSKHSVPFEDYNEPEKENIQVDIDKRQPSIPSLAITDTTKEMSPTRYIDESSEALNEPWIDEPQPPLPPKRRKSTRGSSQDKESLSAHYNKEEWLEDVQNEDMVLDEMIALQREADQDRPLQNGYYDSPPPLPMRKSRSQGTSLADEDRTSRGADSLISETRTHLTEDIEIKPEIKAFTPDYAVVEKTVIEAKPKTVVEKPIRPPPPSRKKKTAAQLTALKNQSINFFFTYPRRAIKKSLLKQQSPAPIRPVRNYSSIGPSRPPRRNRVFREPVYEGEFIPLKAEDDPVQDQEELKKEYFDSEKIDSILLETEADDSLKKKSDQEELQERDLQSGDVIEKMKGRPLPPPPRPPRKNKEDFPDAAYDDDEDLDREASEEVVVERIDILVGHPEHVRRDTEKSLSLPPDDFEPIDEFCERDSEQFLELDASVATPEPIEEPPVKVERRKKSLSTTQVAPTPVYPVEATVSTQTDTLPDGFYVEEEQQTEYSKSEETQSKTPQPEVQKEVEVEKKVETIIEHKVVVIPTPETEILKARKIHVSELDVEKLNVTELQAQKITVSDIDGVSMQVTELTSKSGHLVVSGIDLPSSFLEALIPPPPPAPIIQIQSATQTPPEMTDSQTNTTPQEELPPRFIVQPVEIAPNPSAQPQPLQSPSPVQQPILIPQLIQSQPLLSQLTQPGLYIQTQQPVDSQPTPLPTPSPPQKRPSPPPSIVIQSPQGQSSPAYVPGLIPSSPPPRSPPRTRSHGHDSEEELRMLPRRRRHHSHKHSTQYSSDEEDEEEFPSFPIARRTHQREQNSAELIRQLVSIWQASFMRGVNHVVEGLNTAFPEGEKRKDAQTAACIILVLFAGLIMLGWGTDRTVHHHHWDFLPPNP